jgi:hypothetical protein
MNPNLDKLSKFILSKVLFVVSNFIDDLGCLLLSHLGIHLAWLQLISSVLISCKIIYLTISLVASFYQNRKLRKA